MELILSPAAAYLEPLQGRVAPQARLGSAVRCHSLPSSIQIRTWGKSQSPPGTREQGGGKGLMLTELSPTAATPSSALQQEQAKLFSHNQLYKGILVPGKRSPRAERSKFLSASSAARHPQNLCPCWGSRTETTVTAGAGDWPSWGLSPAQLMPSLPEK